MRALDALRRAAGLDETVQLSTETLADTGEAVSACRITTNETPARAWVAKRLQPSLTRESAAYHGPLSGLDLAPKLAAEVTEEDGGLWIVLEDAGQPLVLPADEAARRDVAELAARVHAVSADSFRRAFWRPRVHVRHGRRHLQGEWRIALDRVKVGVRAGVLDPAAVPSPAEARRVLDEAWAAMDGTTAGLVHGDFQPSNILRAADGTLRAVDWSQWGDGSPLWDLAAATMDQDAPGREQILTAYARARGGRDTGALRRDLDRVLPLRQLLGVGVLAHYAVHGLRRELTAANLPRRLASWDAVRPRESVR